jgi:hypothetical protein
MKGFVTANDVDWAVTEVLKLNADSTETEYLFSNDRLRDDHSDKHGRESGLRRSKISGLI